jgi:glycerophosphoryl diester phosphodiesterase
VPRSRWQAEGYFDVWLPAVAPSEDLLRRFAGHLEEPGARERLFAAYERQMEKTEPRQVIELLAHTGLRVNVELKNSMINYPDLEKRCVELAAHMGMTERVIYSSFNHHSLMRVKAIDPTIYCGLLYDSIMVKPWEYGRALGMNALHPHFSELQIPGECMEAHALGLEVNPWTVNEDTDVRMAFGAGADWLITNYPDRALAILATLKAEKTHA